MKKLAILLSGSLIFACPVLVSAQGNQSDSPIKKTAGAWMFALQIPSCSIQPADVRYDWKKHAFYAYGPGDKLLYEIYMADSGPDEIREGLLRIIKNGKLGFANAYGEIIIVPKYKCAYPFEGGKAKVSCNCKITNDDFGYPVWEGGDWFYIDKAGNTVE